MNQIGPYTLRNNLFLAPMVGVNDTPFREICTQQGAGLTVAEMLTSNRELWQNERNKLKQVKPLTAGPHVVQIAGSDPIQMADAALCNQELGADAIDINMGCPAKKVLKKAAGSALLRDTKLVTCILQAIVSKVNIPVTLKIRTGWCPNTRNGIEIAHIAEDCGIQLLTVHGRTKECRFKGDAEYDTIAAIKQAVQIPVIANGDIDSPEKAAQVLAHTKADGLMIGRGAQGKPWIFKEIEHFLNTGTKLDKMKLLQQLRVINSHLRKLHQFYGGIKGVWYARKHVSVYVKKLTSSREFMAEFNSAEDPQQQLEQLEEYFAHLAGMPTINQSREHGEMAA